MALDGELLYPELPMPSLTHLVCLCLSLWVFPVHTACVGPGCLPWLSFVLYGSLGCALPRLLVCAWEPYGNQLFLPPAVFQPAPVCVCACCVHVLARA